jgi:uncharacterized protein
MLRLLALALVAYLVFRGLESLLRQVRVIPPGQARPNGPAAAPRKAPESVETLVRCAGCGVHVPRSRAVTAADGETYCSEDCRRRAAQSA